MKMFNITYIISTDKEPTGFIIYKATSPTKRIYVGQTINSMEKRIRGHFNDAKRYKGRIFARTLNKYKDKIIWEIIDYANNWDELQRLEQYWIKELHSYYYDNKKYDMNLTYGGDSSKGQKMSEKNKQKQSLRLLEYFKIPENRLKISISHGKKPFNVYDKNFNLIGKWQSQADCARELGLNNTSISACLKGKGKTHGGYVFIYVDEEQSIGKRYEQKGSKKFNVYKKDTLEYIGTWEKQRQAAIDLNINYKFISSCLREKCKSCKGYLFYYIDRDPNLNIIGDEVVCY